MPCFFFSWSHSLYYFGMFFPWAKDLSLHHYGRSKVCVHLNLFRTSFCWITLVETVFGFKTEIVSLTHWRSPVRVRAKPFLFSSRGSIKNHLSVFAKGRGKDVCTSSFSDSWLYWVCCCYWVEESIENNTKWETISLLYKDKSKVYVHLIFSRYYEIILRISLSNCFRYFMKVLNLVLWYWFLYRLYIYKSLHNRSIYIKRR